MYFSKATLSSIILFALTSVNAASSNKCQNIFTDFTKGYGNWTEVTEAKEGFEITDEGLKLTLLRPQEFITKLDPEDNNLPYNVYTSPYAPTFQYKYLLNYGRVTYIMKTPGVSGVVTAGVVMSDKTGDEIDYEMIGDINSHTVQTNYFYGKTPVYNVNMQSDEIDAPTAADFHNYTLDWSPEELKFYIDGKLYRNSPNSKKCDDKGNCEYPTHAGAVKFGIWDASSPSGTAQWARGPVNWAQVNGNITGYVKSVEIWCDPKYNTIVYN